MTSTRRGGSLIRYLFCRAMYRQPATTAAAEPVSSSPNAAVATPLGWYVVNTTKDAHTCSTLKTMISALK
jgi:hypothetical protein